MSPNISSHRTGYFRKFPAPEMNLNLSKDGQCANAIVIFHSDTSEEPVMTYTPRYSICHHFLWGFLKALRKEVNISSLDMDRHGEISSWFTHPVYLRYWHHYQQALAWQQRHMQAYRRALEAFASPPFPGLCAASHARYPDWHLAEGADIEGEGNRLVMTSDPLPSTDWCAPKSSTAQLDTDSNSEIECDVSNMEITDELRQYFAQTERHREELKKQQQKEAEQENAYVLADQDLHRVSWCSTLPPAERPGERRGAEMKKLYGEDAAKIMGMETAMQLNFDRNCDRKQPKYWPVIPLKL